MNMNIDFKLGSVIREIREDKGYSQSDLCKGICHINTIRNIETNTTSPSFELLRAIAGRLGESIDVIIRNAELKRDALYVQQKTQLKKYAEAYDLDACESVLSLIDDELYSKLLASEQQFIDRIRVVIFLHTYNDVEKAYALAEKSLNKTFKKDAYFTREECLLINLMLSMKQSSKNIELAKKALKWIKKKDSYLQDVYAFVLLINGLVMLSYIQENWFELLEYATMGEKAALKLDKSRFIPNFIFMQGLSTYKLMIDQNFGISEMKRAIEYALLIRQLDNYQDLCEYAKKHNIDLA
ncbi:helix-turn-helix domain-containing protein [Listeria innocua]|uniref:helix-turn-helix domain-containing protein n=1 Tax=Listeria innocua TaxID=1642 RepID=UPI001388C763|nr:helix-turn-helix transcriptional regulator [Listeria innocua]EAE7321252.1 XRE family transcriptional regulator [Listeria monocytogenes]EAF9207797.1 XRE family transcriptional regulator [Listeria monocytogenes]EDO1153323.1 helix-turn-helix domain-containing protein [Listeria innocua]EHF3642144.1 helix-turn-helix transcriptional regulator [Listeria innocua]EKE9636815.1 helix-turn-helix transcriptional regulator [Listeria innocua]